MWYHWFASYISSLGFVSSKASNYLFIFDVVLILFSFCYIDDSVLTTKLLIHVMNFLSSEFCMTDFGPLHYFLGISLTRSSFGLFLSQEKFAREIIDRANMTFCNLCATPVDTKAKLSSLGSPTSDPSLYRSFTGALQYLTFTHPDIAYNVQQACLSCIILVNLICLHLNTFFAIFRVFYLKVFIFDLLLLNVL